MICKLRVLGYRSILYHNTAHPGLAKIVLDIARERAE